MSEQSRTARNLIVAKAYLVCILFVGLFVALLGYGSKLNLALAEPGWACFVAAALTVPFLLPTLANKVLPRIHSFRISEIEIALREQVPNITAVAAAARTLSTNLGSDPVLGEYVGRMTSLSSSILEAIQSVQADDHRVLPVDLGTAWVVPNLYFLALMASQKTHIAQFAFVDSRVERDRFVCMCSPDELIRALEWRQPELREAARAARFDLDPRSAEPAVGAEFFQELGKIYDRNQASRSERIPALTPETLLWMLGTAAHRDAVPWTNPPGEKEYTAVIAADSPYVAALAANQLLFVVSRDQVATAVARAAIDRS